jgi:hypothetical protein
MTATTEQRAARLVAELESSGKTVHAVRIVGRAVEVLFTPPQPVSVGAVDQCDAAFGVTR